MKILLFFVLLYLAISTKKIVQEAVYNIITIKNKYLTYSKDELTMSNSNKFEIKSNFRIKQFFNTSYYAIQHVQTNNTIGITNDFKLIIKNNSNSLFFEWIFIKEEDKDDEYIIQNKNGCYLQIIKNNIKCNIIEKEEATKFVLLKVYEEPKHTEEDLKILEKEPIDVVYKYIDLSDPNLKREGIPQIKKDEENQELRYSVRSVLKNIPWVNKIFIILPNEKVRYFKDYDKINPIFSMACQ